MRSLCIYTILLFCIYGCESEVEILDPLADQPVIYCLLNQNSTYQYLRLSRSYLSYEGQKPPENADSLVYFSNVEAHLELSDNNSVLQIIPFEIFKVIKDTGLFPRDPFWVYRAKHRVQEDMTYKLVVYVPETDKILYSECESLSNFSILDPIHPEARILNLQPEQNPVFRWTSSQNALLYQLGFEMHYTDIYPDSIVQKSIEIPIRKSFQNELQHGHYTLPINSNQFYLKISEALPVNLAIQRRFISLDVMIQAGGEDLAYYMQQVENEDPFRIYEFNNLLNSEGVFSAISVEKIAGFEITKQSIDSIAYGRFTKQLNFLDRYGTRKDQLP